ncbi:hypothetical protein HMPREF9248_0949 [Fannyhessea vaginae PB189-T1-4]|uniref:Uncharacterized protein n=1 Tax=Fannyhessea vaginae PB189-T1-4 TaxID=866774 RepID=A0ABN0B087_9ACTN|nr:hypothetical protein HMPREF9248_0949 [Fannyhessea vaginae PB189-T1-4]
MRGCRKHKSVATARRAAAFEQRLSYVHEAMRISKRTLHLRFSTSTACARVCCAVYAAHARKLQRLPIFGVRMVVYYIRMR